MPKDDKSLVIYCVFGIVLGYMVIGAVTGHPASESIMNAALAGLFGIAVGQATVTAPTPKV